MVVCSGRPTELIQAKRNRKGLGSSPTGVSKGKVRIPVSPSKCDKAEKWFRALLGCFTKNQWCVHEAGVRASRASTRGATGLSRHTARARASALNTDLPKICAVVRQAGWWDVSELNLNLLDRNSFNKVKEMKKPQKATEKCYLEI